MKQQSVVNLDPIERSQKKDPGLIGRLLITRPHGGRPAKKTDPFGLYLFCGRQRSGKTVSAVWYAEKLAKKYTKANKTVKLYSNMGIGIAVNMSTVEQLIKSITYDPKVVHIIIIDEIQSYWTKDATTKETKAQIERMVGLFSQLGKRQMYILATAQVYGRVNKSVREQCLYMISCRRSRINSKIVNDFIDGDDIMCDDLGRWSGRPRFIFTHGLPTANFDTHLLITE